MSNWLRTPNVWAKPDEFPLTIADLDGLARDGFQVIGRMALPRMAGDEVLVGEVGGYYVATRVGQQEKEYDFTDQLRHAMMQTANEGGDIPTLGRLVSLLSGGKVDLRNLLLMIDPSPSLFDLETSCSHFGTPTDGS